MNTMQHIMNTDHIITCIRQHIVATGSGRRGQAGTMMFQDDAEAAQAEAAQDQPLSEGSHSDADNVEAPVQAIIDAEHSESDSDLPYPPATPWTATSHYVLGTAALLKPALSQWVEDHYTDAASQPYLSNLLNRITNLMSNFYQWPAVTIIYLLWAMATADHQQASIFTAWLNAIEQHSVTDPADRSPFTPATSWSRILVRRSQWQWWQRYSFFLIRTIQQQGRLWENHLSTFWLLPPCSQCATPTMTICGQCTALLCHRCSTANHGLIRWTQKCAEYGHFLDLY